MANHATQREGNQRKGVLAGVGYWNIFLCNCGVFDYDLFHLGRLQLFAVSVPLFTLYLMFPLLFKNSSAFYTPATHDLKHTQKPNHPPHPTSHTFVIIHPFYQPPMRQPNQPQSVHFCPFYRLALQAPIGTRIRASFLTGRCERETDAILAAGA